MNPKKPTRVKATKPRFTTLFTSKLSSMQRELRRLRRALAEAVGANRRLANEVLKLSAKGRAR